MVADNVKEIWTKAYYRINKPTTFASLLKKTFLEIKGKQGTHRKLQTSQELTISA